MTPEWWKRVNELFEAALARDPARRAEFLDAACSGDAALRREVESLLVADHGAGAFLDAPAIHLAPGSGTSDDASGASRRALEPGSRVGSYEVLGLIAAGGMGEVYRARDERLGRDVALKVLRPGVSDDPQRLQRFEQEARAAGRLNHPNVLAIHDVGRHEGAPYLVSELLEGETLRERLEKDGAFVPAKALRFGIQIVHGLAAAHAKGIVHRDLKPENLFVTREGHVKILDFGLAKLTQASTGIGVADDGPTLLKTAPGTVMGTVAYMSPEQVRGETVDPRSDIFAFGAILYEMLSGRRAFQGDSAFETLNAILKQEPPDLTRLDPRLGAGLDRLLRHCLEKRPEERFQSARDLAFDLEALAETSGAGAPAPAAALPRRRRRPAAFAWTLAALALALGGYLLGARLAEKPIPSFRQLTFRRGTVTSARFSPDGNTVFYSAAWEGRPAEVFSMRLDGVESRSLGLSATRLLATGPGEMAVLLRSSQDGGTLARVPLEGGVPREVLEDVRAADWTADAARFAVVRGVRGRTRLEFPLGKTVHETAGNVESPRVSPDGSRVAFIDQPMLGNTPGAVVVVDAGGRTRTLSEGWTDAGGLAWAPDGGEIWFSAARTGTARSLHAVSLGGRYRLVARAPNAMVLQDISAAGRVLLTHAHQRSEALARFAGSEGEKDLSWFDWTHPCDLSADGRRLLFTAEGEGGGPRYTVYLRESDSPPVRLGEGHATELSPDGASALAMLLSPPRLLVLPTGPGEPKTLSPAEGIVEHHWAWWFPDGKRILFLGNKPGRPSQLFVQDVPDGRPRPLAPEGVTAYRHKPISPDGRFVVALAPGDAGARFVLWPVEGGKPQPVPGLDPRDQPIRWCADGRSLFVRARGPILPVRIERLDLQSGRSTPWKELSPADLAGVDHIGDLLLSPDGQSSVLSCWRPLSELYLVEGLQ